MVEADSQEGAAVASRAGAVGEASRTVAVEEEVTAAAVTVAADGNRDFSLTSKTADGLRPPFFMLK